MLFWHLILSVSCNAQAFNLFIRQSIMYNEALSCLGLKSYKFFKLFHPVVCQDPHKTISSRIVTSYLKGFPCLEVYNWACSIKAFLQVPEACFYFLIHCQTTFFLVHFSCLGICQVVPHCVVAHGIEEGELFICRH